MNFERCRACLNTNAPEYIDMEALLSCGQVCYLDFFNQCTQLDIQLDKVLPRTLCNSCSNDLAAAYMFVQTAKQAHATLQREIESKAVVVVDDEGNHHMMMECIVLDEIVTEDEEHIVDEIMEMDLSTADLEYAEFHALTCAPKIEPKSPTNATHHQLEYYAEDEADDEYLVEFNEEELPTENCIKIEVNADIDLEAKNGHKWRCTECKRVLRGNVSYVGHMNMHRDRRPYPCDVCRCAFRCKNSLERHKLARHVNVTKFEDQENNQNDSDATLCTHCLREFANGFALNEHVELVHETTSTCLCPYCMTSPATVLQRSEVAQHMQLEHAVQYELHYGIKEDSASSSSIKASRTVECPLCRKQLQHKNLDKHLLMHKTKDNAKDNKFLCSYCPRELKNQKSLAQHEKMHVGESDEDVFICEECNRTYATQFLLDCHRKQAHKERDNVCNICGNAFKLKNQLVNHMKLHLEKNIKCPHCEKRYARPYDLNVHLRSHTGELPYACHLCDRRFAIKVRLTYHLQRHYGTKHPCRECGAEFNSRQKLKEHTYKHTGMPYRCELCINRGFANRDVFKRHLLRVHNTTLTDDELVAMFQRNTGKTIRIMEVQKCHNSSAITETQNTP